MEMLTDKFDDGTIGLKEMFDSDSLIEVGTLFKDPYISARLVQAMELLHKYELTGFTPEEHEDLKICLDTEGNGKSGENLLYDLLELLRYRQAEEQGLLHKAPIPNGTQIYKINQMSVEECLYYNFATDRIIQETYIYGYTEVQDGEMNIDWFLTKEAAEAALKERESIGL